MNADELKISIHGLVDKIEDVNLLKAFRDTLKSVLKGFDGIQTSEGFKNDKVVLHTGEGQPLTKKQLEAMVLEAVERVRAGKFISQNELNKEVENW